MNARNICLRIISKTQLFAYVVEPQRGSTNMQQYSLEVMGISDRGSHVNPGRWYRWKKPPEGCYKLNVDGSARLNEMTGGGILRDHNGDLIAAFSSHYGLGTSNSAEFSALLEGRALNISNLLVECDSKLVCNAVNKG